MSARWRPYHVGKRVLDVVLSGLGLVVCAPLILVLACLVRLRIGAPAFFVQVRAGRHGQPFRMVKLRTMTEARDRDGKLQPDAQRLTKFGVFLRSTSLDELPELWNVLRGEMSLVGPRPLLLEYLPLYSQEQARRHLVAPGITGWAQVNGRNGLSWEEKFALDVWYVDHCGLRLDVKILAMTALPVLFRRHIAPEGHDTMPAFKGGSP